MRGQWLGLLALLAVSVSTGIAGCGGADAENNQAGEDAADVRREPEQPQGDEAYKERVRAWLRENLNTPEWDEVAWEEPIENEDFGRTQYSIKIRTPSPEGGKVLKRFIFLIRHDDGELLDAREVPNG